MSLLADIEKIEQRLNEEGDTSAVRKAFWRIVGRIKRQDPNKVEDEVIEKAAELRNRLFKKRVVLNVGKGLLIFGIIALLSFSGFIWMLLNGTQFITNIVLYNGVLLVIGIFIFYGVYPIGRYLGGVIARVKFEGFYRYSPVELGVKIEYVSYLKTTQSRRKWVFGFPIFGVAAFIILQILSAWIINRQGIWAPLFFLIIFPFFYYAIYRVKEGEVYRFIRELRIARELKYK